MRRSSLLQVFAGIVLLGAMWAFRDSTSSREFLTQAREYAISGERELARDAYRQHLAKRPSDDAARLELGEFLKPTDAEAALVEFQQIPPEAPQYLIARRHIAHISIIRGDDVTAQSELERLAESTPDDLAIALSLTELYFRTGQFKNALPIARHVVELAPERAESYQLLAEILDGLGRTPEMIAPLERALRLNSNDYRSHSLLAFALHHSARLDEAEQQIQWCLSQRSNDAFIWRVMASISRERGDRKEALTQIRRAIALQPDDVRCRLLKADLLLYDRMAEEAWETLAPLRKIQSTNRDFLGALARAAAMSGRLDEARACQKTIESIIKQSTTERESTGLMTQP
jgi:predicted Zn-dependent protease